MEHVISLEIRLTTFKHRLIVSLNLKLVVDGKMATVCTSEALIGFVYEIFDRYQILYIT